MADSPPDSYGDPADATGVAPERGSTPSTPNWVKVSGIVALLLVVLSVVLLLTGGAPGGHGPGRHTGSGDADGRTPFRGVTEAHTPLPGSPERGTHRP